jgi:hypothetical protein
VVRPELAEGEGARVSESKTYPGPLAFSVGGPLEGRAPAPTVGRIVHYENGGSKALPAMVTVVHTETVVDLVVFMQTGISFRLQVPLIGTVGGSDPGIWVWPPRA